jgi:hypothetical protein
VKAFFPAVFFRVVLLFLQIVFATGGFALCGVTGCKEKKSKKTGTAAPAAAARTAAAQAGAGAKEGADPQAGARAKEGADPQAGARAKEGADPQAGARAAVLASAPTAVRFVAERVVLEMRAQSVAVAGRYTFTNSSGRWWRGRIGYPVYVSKDQPAPKQVIWHRSRDGLTDRRAETVKLDVSCRRPNRCGAIFALSLAPRQKRVVRLSYRQPLARPQAIYLLSTARRWGRPLERAELIVRVPDQWKKVHVSHRPNTVTKEGRQRVYRILRTHFVPQRELTVRRAGGDNSSFARSERILHDLSRR